MNRNLLALVVGTGLFTSGTALAQETSVVEGPGYPLGEGSVVHPSLGAEVGVVNNVFYEEQASNPYTSGLLRLVAEAALASKEIREEEQPDPFLDPGAEPAAPPAPPKVEFRAGGKLAYEEYLHPESVVRAQRNLSADLIGHLVANPQGTFAFSADERLVRDTRPTNHESTQGTNRIANNLALALMFQPGGRQIVGSLKWENQIDFFEDTTQRFANRMQNAFHLRGDWHWLPYTKFFADASLGFIGGLGDNDLGGMPYKRSAMPIRGGVGIATAITEIFTVKAHLGWAYASYSGGASYNRPTLGAEIGYRYSPVGRVVVEYNWDHRDSINADYYTDHHFGAHVDQAFGARVVASLRGEARLRAYRGVHPSLGAPDRNDVIFAAGANVQYVLKDWMAIVADWRTDIDQTDYMSIAGDGTDDPGYAHTEVVAGVRAAF